MLFTETFTHYHSTVIHSLTWPIKIHHYVGMDHDHSHPWTLLNIVKRLKFGLFIEPPEQYTIERNKAFQMVTDGVTFQRQSWIPDAPEGTQC